MLYVISSERGKEEDNDNKIEWKIMANEGARLTISYDGNIGMEGKYVNLHFVSFNFSFKEITFWKNKI